MRNKNNIVLAVGIGLLGLFVVLILLRTMPSDNSGSTQDGAVVDVAFGSIRLPDEISQFEAAGPKDTVKIEPDKQAKRLPVGQYHIRFWKTERKDDGGNTWALSGYYFGQDNPFEIKDSDETKLDIGEPIIATVDVRNVGSSYSFNQVIKGRHQETIELRRNGSRPQPPKLHIKNKDGSYDRTFSFQYG